MWDLGEPPPNSDIFPFFSHIENVPKCHVQLKSQWSVQLYNNQSLVGHDRLRSCKRETKWLLRVVHNKWQSYDSLKNCSSKSHIVHVDSQGVVG